MADDSFSVVLTRTASKEVLSLQPKAARQIEGAIERLVRTLNTGERPQDMKRLQGRPHTFRLDSGEYRVLFELDVERRLVTIFRVRNRRDAYRGL